MLFDAAVLISIFAAVCEEMIICRAILVGIVYGLSRSVSRVGSSLRAVLNRLVAAAADCRGHARIAAG